MPSRKSWNLKRIFDGRKGQACPTLREGTVQEAGEGDVVPKLTYD